MKKTYELIDEKDTCLLKESDSRERFLLEKERKSEERKSREKERRNQRLQEEAIRQAQEKELKHVHFILFLTIGLNFFAFLWGWLYNMKDDSDFEIFSNFLLFHFFGQIIVYKYADKKTGTFYHWPFFLPFISAFLDIVIFLAVKDNIY